jgi:hypothetical protein
MNHRIYGLLVNSGELRQIFAKVELAYLCCEFLAKWIDASNGQGIRDKANFVEKSDRS